MQTYNTHTLLIDETERPRRIVNTAAKIPVPIEAALPHACFTKKVTKDQRRRPLHLALGRLSRLARIQQKSNESKGGKGKIKNLADEVMLSICRRWRRGEVLCPLIHVR